MKTTTDPRANGEVVPKIDSRNNIKEKDYCDDVKSISPSIIEMKSS